MIRPVQPRRVRLGTEHEESDSIAWLKFWQACAEYRKFVVLRNKAVAAEYRGRRS